MSVLHPAHFSLFSSTPLRRISFVIQFPQPPFIKCIQQHIPFILWLECNSVSPSSEQSNESYMGKQSCWRWLELERHFGIQREFKHVQFMHKSVRSSTHFRLLLCSPPSAWIHPALAYVKCEYTYIAAFEWAERHSKHVSGSCLGKWKRRIFGEGRNVCRQREKRCFWHREFICFRVYFINFTFSSVLSRIFTLTSFTFFSHSHSLSILSYFLSIVDVFYLSIDWFSLQNISLDI